MFELKAIYNGTEVDFGTGRTYRCNEILTQCLEQTVNIETLLDFRAELARRKHELFLLREEKRLKDYAYRQAVVDSQKLLLRIGKIANSLPPYRDMKNNRFCDPTVLTDLLNNYQELFSELSHDDSEEDDDDEDGLAASAYYITNFAPEYGLIHDMEELQYQCKELNLDITVLFGFYESFINDLILVSRVFQPMLDVLHTESRFPDEQQTVKAVTFAKQQAKQFLVKFEKATTQTSYDVAVHGTQSRLCETQRFMSLGDFLYFDFFKGFFANYIPRKCGNCGHYFLLTAGKYVGYCDRPLKDDKKKSCQDIGSRKKYDEKCKTDPIWQTYNRAYKAHYARYMKKKMTVAEFEQWSSQATKWREEALTGKLAYEVFYETIRK